MRPVKDVSCHKRITKITFRIANTFTDNLAKLRDNEKKAVKTTVFDTLPIRLGTRNICAQSTLAELRR